MLTSKKNSFFYPPHLNINKVKFAYRNRSISISMLIVYFTIFVTLIMRLTFYTKANLLVEEAYYWNYSEHLDFSFLDHPPMVAILIYLSTKLFGLNELTVRLPAFLCWVGSVFFAFKLTELISKNAGVYTILLLSFLPVFLIQSLIMTPDEPLMLCWVATLYYLHRALIEEEKNAWYHVGIWFGLGLLSKYTIVLLMPSALLYMIMSKSSRHYFLKKEPYISACIAFLIFSPVIYWNATHNWVSFAFQSVRRFSYKATFSLPSFLLLIFLFLTHVGCYGLFQFLRKNSNHALNEKNRQFIYIFSILPLAFFCYVSFTQIVKINWISPTLIPLLPWLAHLMKHADLKHFINNKNSWLVTCVCLLLTYSIFLSYVLSDFPNLHLQQLLRNNKSWITLTNDIYSIGEKVEKKYKVTPIFISLDFYHLISEFSFYQAFQLRHKKINKPYKIIGGHLFDRESLMYKYWYNKTLPENSILVLLSDNKVFFNFNSVKKNTLLLENTKKLKAMSRGGKKVVQTYYYQIVKTIHTLNKSSKST